MPAPSKISKLPAPLRARLDARLVANGFGGLVELASWLTNEGHPVGKSALGQYALEHRKAIEAAVAASTGGDQREASRAEDMRLRVLEVAATQSGPEDLLERAERLLAWVLKG